MNKKINKALNEQIHSEMNASYLYLSMSAFCEALNFSGFAHWMRKQSEEEYSHAMKLFDYVHTRGGQVTLQGIEEPEGNFKTPAKMFASALKHEKAMTESIHDLYQQATKEQDHPTEVELQWFIAEQVEEEKTASQILNQVEMLGDNPVALLMLDRQLGQRQ